MNSTYGFTSFQEIARRAAGRDLVLFGAGNIAAKTVPRLGPRIRYIVDNNANLWNTEQLGVKVQKPSVLKEQDRPPFVIICTTSFLEVSRQLNELGFEVERDILVSPILNDLRIIAEMESHSVELLFSNGLPPSEDPRQGGGLYELSLDGEWSHRKVHSGSCHGIIRFGDNLVFVDDELGLTEVDRSYSVVRSQPLPPGSRGHGVAYCEELKKFYVVCSYVDKVLSFDDRLRPDEEIRLSRKFDQLGQPSHHCNDACVVGTSLYVSMFSATGNWKRDIFDGAIIEYDLTTGEKVGPVVSDLWMPHNVDYIDGSLVVLDSLRGQLRRGNAQSVGEFPAFARGLAHDGIFFYVGQSRNRNYSRYLGLSKNISIDTSIIMFDEHTKVSRSLQLPSKVSEIHAVVVL